MGRPNCRDWGSELDCITDFIQNLIHIHHAAFGRHKNLRCDQAKCGYQ